MTSGHVDGDAAEQPTRRDGDQPSLTDPSEEHRLTQRPVLVSDQPAWDAGLTEIDSNLGGNPEWSLGADQNELGLGPTGKWIA
ncbi:hypothetical protein GCM10009665_19900 [Kitasatospora nipponensis]|uniref:Uncharacterized protein n=1 Tax=Kitasatospora nipponensis TaxID=258049 RepID=A0ABP4GLS7_9ACTN